MCLRIFKLSLQLFLVCVLSLAAVAADSPWTSSNNAGLAALAAGQFGKAAGFFTEAMDQSKGFPQPDKQNRFAASMTNLAEARFDQGKYTESEELYKRAIALTEQNVGKDHPTLALSLSGLGNLYRHQGRLTEAKPLLVRAVAIDREAIGADPSDLAATLNNLAVWYVRCIGTQRQSHSFTEGSNRRFGERRRR